MHVGPSFEVGPSTLPPLAPVAYHNPPPTASSTKKNNNNYDQRARVRGYLYIFSTISQIALLIIGVMGAAGYFNPLVLGCSTAALGAPISAILISGNFDLFDYKDKRIATGLFLIQTAVLVSSVCLGILGACGLLTLNQLSWIAISIFLLTAVVHVITCINSEGLK